MELLGYLLAYGALTFAFILWHLRRRRQRHAEERTTLEEARQAGLNEPPSLHPVVDPNRCFGSGACARACPEGALGVVDGKATLVNGSACIGHGACFHACPVQALTLVFGTEKRGIDIPHVSENFETNVPGVFIAGELGGMGLIRKTAEQGRQAMAAIQRRNGHHAAPLDVLIVGAGPAGLSAGLSAIHHRLRYALIEQEDGLGGAVYHYPRNKIAMTAPVKLDVVGTVRLGTEVQKEKLLAFWTDIVQRTQLQVRFREQFLNLVARDDGTFDVETSRAQYHCRSVLLAMGRRGTPRKLEVPGEEEPNVVYRLVDPAQYEGKTVLVVGGGDSALEAAIALAQQPGVGAMLSYRGGAFSRVKAKNRAQVEEMQAQGRLGLYLQSQVRAVRPGEVDFEHDGCVRVMKADQVIVCAGGVLPTPLLQKIGIRFETKFGHA